MSTSEKEIITEGGNLRYIWIGATHMLSGYDHLAFIFGMVFFLTRFNDIVKYITVFTLGHSITLIIATLNAYQVNYFLIDAVIALSVSYIGFYNLDGLKKYFDVKKTNILSMIFGLGLIHGLGLSTRLQELPLSQDNLLLNIISFNIGIEFGQILALAIMLFFMTFFRKLNSFKKYSKFFNIFLIIFGAYLFVIQMYDYINTTKQNSQWKDTVIVTIPSQGEKEYKVDVIKDSSFTYSWKVDKGVLYFDFHGEPEGDTTGYFKTFKKGMKEEVKGSLTTTFTGTHGWYWKNYNPYPINITLNLNGQYQLRSK
jgi:hypothetical protein